jgi:signal transduction histidine kinase
VAAAAALWVTAGRAGVPARAALGLAGGAAVAVGLVLAVQVQRGLTAAATTVERLQRGLPASPAPVQAGWPVAALLEQISALVASETQLGAVREQLLHQTAAAAAQEERNRLARDLHDSIKQQIFAISVSAAAVQARWDQDPDGARTALAEVRRSAQEAMVELRAMLQQLRPAPLESVGLVEALRDQGQALAYRTGAKVDLNIGGLAEEERLPVGAQETLFRIAQEAFANVARHARASHVRVGLGVYAPRGREMLLLEVDDDGQGFEPLHVPTSGVGLSNMSERIRVLQGTLEVRSAPGAGTTIRAGIPLEQPGTATDGASQAARSRRRLLLVVLATVGVVAAVTVATTGSPVLAAVPAAGAILAAVSVVVLGRRGSGRPALPAQMSTSDRPRGGTSR